MVSADGKSCEQLGSSAVLTYKLLLVSHPDWVLGRAMLQIGSDPTRLEETVSYSQNYDWWGGNRIGRRFRQSWTLDASGAETLALEVNEESVECKVSRRRWGKATFGASDISYTFQRLDKTSTVSLPFGGKRPVPMMGAFEYPSYPIACSSPAFYTQVLKRYQAGGSDPQHIDVFWPAAAQVSQVRVSADATWTASKPVLRLPDYQIRVVYDGDGYPESIVLEQEEVTWSRYEGAPADLNMVELPQATTFTPDPLPTDGQESSVAITSDDGTKLAGTLTLPGSGSGPFPAVLMVVDPSALDRDAPMYTLPQPLLRHLAAHLAAAGYASLRYDPRGRGESGGDGSTLTLTQLVQDAAAAHGVLAAATAVDSGSLFLLSHGTGSVTAISLLDPQRKGAGIKGYLALAPVIKEVDKATLYRGIEHLKAAKCSNKFIQQYDQSIGDDLTQLAAGTYVGDVYLGLSAGLWQEMLAFDGSSTLVGFPGPVLALRGDQDLDFPPEQLQAAQDAATQAGKTNLSTQTIAGLSALLGAGDMQTLLEQNLLPLSLPQAALGPITNWLDANK